MITIRAKTKTSDDPAREKILLRAQTLFASKGYAGTSMSQISQAAGVSKALIYHHFKDKNTLWKMVKQSIFENSSILKTQQVPTNKGLRVFLEAIIRQRFHVYQSNPNLARMITWQSLEEDNSELIGGTTMSPLDWEQALEQFQTQGELKEDLRPELVLPYILSAVMPITTPYFRNILKDEEKSEQYLQMAIDFVCQNLSPK